MINIRMSTKSKFTNELGNKIDIKVTSTSTTGVNNEGAKRRFNAVKLTIVGPTSLSENTITLVEARELLKCLREYLKGQPKESNVR